MQTKLVTLNESDNVLICCQSLHSNESIEIDQQRLVVSCAIDVGHKIARRAIKQGEKVIRWGVPIGSATLDIEQGEHVHIHNMKSDYIPSYTRQAKVGE